MFDSTLESPDHATTEEKEQSEHDRGAGRPHCRSMNLEICSSLITK